LPECLISTSNLNARAAYLSRKNFFVQGVLKIERRTQNQAAGIFPLGMVAQFISNVGVKTSLLARRDETPANIKQRSTTKILTIYAV
jgi:hypothetical protein